MYKHSVEQKDILCLVHRATIPRFYAIFVSQLSKKLQSWIFSQNTNVGSWPLLFFPLFSDALLLVFLQNITILTECVLLQFEQNSILIQRTAKVPTCRKVGYKMSHQAGTSNFLCIVLCFSKLWFSRHFFYCCPLQFNS